MSYPSCSPVLYLPSMLFSLSLCFVLFFICNLMSITVNSFSPETAYYTLEFTVIITENIKRFSRNISNTRSRFFTTLPKTEKRVEKYDA